MKRLYAAYERELEEELERLQLERPWATHNDAIDNDERTEEIRAELRAIESLNERQEANG